MKKRWSPLLVLLSVAVPAAGQSVVPGQAAEVRVNKVPDSKLCEGTYEIQKVDRDNSVLGVLRQDKDGQQPQSSSFGVDERAVPGWTLKYAAGQRVTLRCTQHPEAGTLVVGISPARGSN